MAQMLTVPKPQNVLSDVQLDAGEEDDGDTTDAE